LLRKKALRPLDKTKLPNLKNLKTEFRDPWYDPGMRYAVPYATSVTLLGYNARRLAQRGLPTDTWALIFEPRTSRKLKGKVTVLNSQRELMAAAMKYLGYSVQETDPARWEEAKRMILRAKPYWANFSNSTYIKDLAIGNIWVAHGYSSDMYRAQQDALEARRPFPSISGRRRKARCWRSTVSFCTNRAGAPTSRTSSSTSCSMAPTPPMSRT
jgi:spermidine/putrescine transport system substrate-binding protein